MNIYEMYIHNGNKCGFKVRRNNWPQTGFAIVISIDGKKEGELDGKPPYFGNPKVIAWHVNDKKIRPLLSPGTYNYTFLEHGEPKK